jgi:hypothetical protein
MERPTVPVNLCKPAFCSLILKHGRSQLAKEWPHYSAEHMTEEVWWYSLDKQDLKSITLEPEGEYQGWFWAA